MMYWPTNEQHDVSEKQLDPAAAPADDAMHRHDGDGNL